VNVTLTESPENATAVPLRGTSSGAADAARSDVRWEVRGYSECMTVRAVNVELENRRLETEAVAAEYGELLSAGVVDRDGAVFRGDVAVSAGKRPGTRGVVSGWSGASRRNLLRTAAQTVFPSATATGMLTLTYPGDWVLCSTGEVRTPRKVKAELAAWRKRMDRHVWSTGEAVPLSAMWKMETQRRSAPHFHVGVVIPDGVPSREFAVAAAEHWCAVVGGDPAHSRFACRLDVSLGRGKSRRGSLAAYFAKHGVWSTKSYQNRPASVAIAEAMQFVRLFTVDLGASLQTALPVGPPLPAPAPGPVPLPAALEWWAEFGSLWEHPGRWWGLWRLDRPELFTAVVSEPVVRVARLIARKVQRRRTARVVSVGDRRVVMSRVLRSLYPRVAVGFDGTDAVAYEFPPVGWWTHSREGPVFTAWLWGTACELSDLDGVELARALASLELPEFERRRVFVLRADCA